MIDNEWINIHANKEYNVKYPFDSVISFILKYKSFFEKPKVLDFGCGVGNNSRFVAEQKEITLYAVDISSDAIEQADLYLKENNLSANFVCAGVGQLPFNNDEFDLIFERALLMCLPNDLLSVFSDDCYRMLRRGGYLHITPYSFSHTSFKNERPSDNGLVYNMKLGALANLNRGLRAMTLEEIKLNFNENLWDYIKVEERVFNDQVSNDIVAYWNIILKKK